MDGNTSKIALNVKALREEKGWTQAELGEKLYVSDKLVSKWERGESIPDTDAVTKLAELAGKSVGEFTGGERLWSSESVVKPPVKRRLVYNPVSFIADLGIVALLAAMWAISAKEYSSLPDIIGIHFGVDGTADGFGGKGFVFLMPAISTVALAACVFEAAQFLGVAFIATGVTYAISASVRIAVLLSAFVGAATLYYVKFAKIRSDESIIRVALDSGVLSD